MKLDQLQSFKHLWQEAAGLTNKLQLGACLAAAKLTPGKLQPRLPTVSISFRRFNVAFRLSRGELTPYEQILADLRMGVIPQPVAGEQWLILDCGANIGLFSLFMKDAGRIIAVEPNPD